MALANLASRVLFWDVPSEVPFERAVRCDKSNAVGASIGQVWERPGRHRKRKEGYFETRWVEGDFVPDVRDMWGRSVVLVMGVVMDGMGGSVLLLREKRQRRVYALELLSERIEGRL